MVARRDHNRRISKTQKVIATILFVGGGLLLGAAVAALTSIAQLAASM